jgi:ADP-ribose pyrophosphatase YjhB (NUDIX family)
VTPGPRAIAIGIIRRRDEILVFAVPDEVKGVTGWRAPGGGIEFGERGEDTVARELQEELGVRVVGPRYLGTIENVFVYQGEPGHEIVRAYEVRFADGSLYERDRFECVEANGARFTCVWRRLAEFGGGAPLYPEGLLPLLG